MATASVTRPTRSNTRPIQRKPPAEVDPAQPVPGELSLPALTASPQRVEMDSWGDPLHASAVPLLPDLGSVESEVMSRLVLTRTGLPDVGQTFGNFQLLAELGRGAFGRVFLARQGELADRLVALKISTESLTESQKLAQLQHTHIVPIYSFHRDGAIQAVCMPFLGSTTLADVLLDLQQRKSLPVSGKGLVSTLHERKSRTAQTLDSLRSAGSLPALPAPTQTPTLAPLAGGKTGGVALQHLEGLTYVEAVLWLGIRLADGLAHAHERGIIHRDLKPANILLTDDGQPLLLDFNLAEDVKQGGAMAAMLGGTLPYMSPEHLDAFLGTFQTVDHRSDIYALGLILVELLLGRHPFTRFQGPPEMALAKMAAERRQAPPRLRAGNPAISPAVEAILRKCLDPDPAKRYQTAHDLHDDLERQLSHRPLLHAPEPSLGERVGKWARRHPSLSSGSTIAAFFTILVLVLGFSLAGWWRQAAWLGDKAKVRTLKDEVAHLRTYLGVPLEQREQRKEGAEKVRLALPPFLALDRDEPPEMPRALPPEEQNEFRAQLANLLIILAGTEADLAQALAANERAASLLADTGVPRYVYLQQASLLADLNREDDRAAALQKAEASPIRGAWDHFFQAREHLRRNELVKAITALKAATKQDRDNMAAWYLLGNCCLEGAPFQMAEKTDPILAYSKCEDHLRWFHGFWVNRGLAQLRLMRYEEARSDFDEAIELRPDLAEGYLQRALVLEAIGEKDAALSDVNDALRLGQRTPRALVVRARLRSALGDWAGSQKDRAEALALEPRDEEGFLVRGVTRLKTDVQGALADFKEAVVRNPRSRAGYANQAVVLALKLNQPREAVALLDRLVQIYPTLATAYADRGFLQARLGNRDAALRDANEALKACNRENREAGETFYQVAYIYVLTSATNPADKDIAIGLLKDAVKHDYGHDLLERDPKLTPLRKDPAFLALVKAAQELKSGPKRI